VLSETKYGSRCLGAADSIKRRAFLYLSVAYEIVAHSCFSEADRGWVRGHDLKAVEMVLIGILVPLTSFGGSIMYF
jgi:hypothetical protein